MLRRDKITNYFFLALLSFVLVLAIGVIPGYSKLTQHSFQPSTFQLAANPSALEQQAQQLYEAGQFAQATQLLKQAIADSTNLKDELGQARRLRNLALAYQQLGEMGNANEAIKDSLNRLQTTQNLGNTTQRTQLLAQALDVQGKLQLYSGQSEQALDTWKQAADNYQKIGDLIGITRSKINQAQALQTLGLYSQSIRTLTEVRGTLQEQPDSLLKAKGLQSLGEALRVVGDLNQSQKVLQESLVVAEKLQARDSMAATLISLGNTAKLLKQTQAALGFYQRAATESPSPTTQIQAQLNQLRLLIDQKQWPDAYALAPKIKSGLTSLPPSRMTIYAQINLAESLMKLGNREWRMGNGEKSSQFPIPSDIAPLLATAVQQARSLGDLRAEAYALGSLGGVYEKNQQLDNAQQLTEQALMKAQTINAADIAYQWQWQLGRILKVRGNQAAATATYTEAVKTLKSLRSDLVTISSDVQFSFRESVEPIYRELVGLLLDTSSKGISQKSLIQAREVIESLQLAELDNFFRDACIDAKPAQIDQIDKSAAVFYPIILSDRLEVILALPGQDLRHYATALPKEKIERTLKSLLDAVLVPSLQLTLENFLEPSQQVYDWLIRPVEAELAASGVKTLVFVPDGAIRNIPLSALYDGKEYLVQKYSVAIAPGLQLVDPQPLKRQKLQVLAFGLTEARQDFPPLPNVQGELDRIKAEVESRVLFNESFTDSNFKEAIKRYPFPVVHLATHGEFSSEATNTFVLTWDDRVTAQDFTNLLGIEQGNRTRPIELLVLSACQTAEGDDRAALGLAGVAVRAGARSTLASLWFVSDEATSLLMTEFYRELSNTQETKAEVLRRAQAAVLQNEQFSHPYFWSAFILVGNWL